MGLYKMEKSEPDTEELVRPTRPDPDDFGDDTAAYDRAVDKHELDMEEYREKKLEAKMVDRLHQTTAQRARAEISANYLKEENKARAKIDDYDEVVDDVIQDLSVLGNKGKAIKLIIEETGNPYILYAMKDPDIFERVATAPTPTMVSYQLAKIEQGMGKQPRKKHETTTPPGGGGGSATNLKPRKGDSVETIIEKRRKQRAA